jgi:hypothetical protein
MSCESLFPTEYPVDVSCGDLVIINHTPNLGVVLEVSDYLQFGAIVRDSEGAYSGISGGGTYSGHVRVVGRMSLEDIVEGVLDHMKFRSEIIDEQRALLAEALEKQTKLSPVQYTPRYWRD